MVGQMILEGVMSPSKHRLHSDLKMQRKQLLGVGGQSLDEELARSLQSQDQ